MSQFDGLLNITGKKEKPKEKVIPKKSEKQRSATPPPMEKLKSQKPLAKSQDERFVQTSIYIKRDTQVQVKTRLLTDSKGRDFSDLVEELLSNWLSQNN